MNVNNYSESKANLYPETYNNGSGIASLDDKIGRKLQIKEQMGGYNASLNVVNASWNMVKNPDPYNRNFQGLRTSHYIPQNGRFQWDLSNRNDSRQKVPDSAVAFTDSVEIQIPKAFYN